MDEEMLELIESYPAKIGALIDSYKIKDSVFEMMSLARAANKYFNDSEPWKSVKTDKEKCATTINICLQTIYTLAEVFSTVLPFTSDKLFKMLNAEKTSWQESGKSNLEDGHQINKAEILFTKIDDKVIDEQINKWSKPEEEEEKIPQITFDEFMKVDLKIAKILQAEKIKKSDKLLKLQVDLGKEKRQVVAGIAQSYEPESLIGKKIVLVANLQPAKLFGVESQGMILAIEDENGKLSVLEVEPDVKVGTKVR
jgi:methionyl-tRNA synthetase